MRMNGARMCRMHTIRPGLREVNKVNPVNDGLTRKLS